MLARESYRIYAEEMEANKVSSERSENYVGQSKVQQFTISK